MKAYAEAMGKDGDALRAAANEAQVCTANIYPVLLQSIMRIVHTTWTSEGA